MIRITENDKKFGPFMYGRGSTNSWGIFFNTSQYEEDGEHHTNHLWINLFGWIVVWILPFWVQPHRTKIFPKSWDEATVKRLGRNWYWQCDNRRWGFSIHDNYFQLFYGRQSDDSTLEKRKSWHFPWSEWTIVRRSLFHGDGTHHFTENFVKGRSVVDWKEMSEIKKKIVKQTVDIMDYDGTRLVAMLHIDELEWVRGVRSFAWLKYIFKPKIRRSLQIEFSEEVGNRKGSWKGGLMGTSIDMLPGEDSFQAFRRYCDTQSVSRDRNHKLTIIGFNRIDLFYKEITCPSK